MLPDVEMMKTDSKSMNVDLGCCMDRPSSLLHGPAGPPPWYAACKLRTSLISALTYLLTGPIQTRYNLVMLGGDLVNLATILFFGMAAILGHLYIESATTLCYAVVAQW